MRELLRLITLFLATVVAMVLSFGAGFATAKRMPGLVSDTPGPASVPLTSVATSEPEADVVPGPALGEMDLLWEAWDRVQDAAYGPLPEESEITYGALRGSLRALDDPYTIFTDPKLTEIERPELEREFEGIGAFVGQNRDGQLIIQTPMRGQPAEKAGVLAGDIVIEVDGVNIEGMSTEDAVLLIRGPKGTTVTLTIIREGLSQPMKIDVVRDRVEIPSVNEARMLTEEGAPDAGYLQLTVFAADTESELEYEIDRLRQEGAQVLVLDLRNNPGGFLNSAVDVASQFLEAGQVVAFQEDKYGNRTAEHAQPGGHALDLPVVVLVNRGSASASEIVAGALRDHGRGILVGETTFGKGSVQNVHNLSDDSQLRVTVAVWLTPDESLIHDQGIEPDIEVELTREDVEAEVDPQLQRAVQEALRLLNEEGM